KKVTLANYQQLKGGMTQAEVENLLGAPFLKVPDPSKKNTLCSWVSVPDTIDITFYDGKVQRWTGFIGGQVYGPMTDPNVGTPSDPNPGSKITQAMFDMI